MEREVLARRLAHAQGREMLSSRLAHAEGRAEGMEEMAQYRLQHIEAELRIIRKLIEVYDRPRIAEARARLRALLGLEG